MRNRRVGERSVKRVASKWDEVLLAPRDKARIALVSNISIVVTRDNLRSKDS